MNKEQSIQAAADHNLIEKKTIDYRGFKILVGNDGYLYNQDGQKTKLQKNSSGYLTRNKKNKGVLVHRVVAMAFIPNPMNKPQVNHKNGNKEDNRVANLEWVTQSENQIHCIRVIGRKSNAEGLKKWRENGGTSSTNKEVVAHSISTNNTITFNSGVEASNYFKCCKSNIWAVIKYKRVINGYLLSHKPTNNLTAHNAIAAVYKPL